MFGRQLWTDTVSTENGINKLRNALAESDAIIIGAGAGLSTSAGFTYTGERFQNTFSILQRNTDFGICIPAAFIRLTGWRNIGHIGADTSWSTVI